MTSKKPVFLCAVLVLALAALFAHGLTWPDERAQAAPLHDTMTTPEGVVIDVYVTGVRARDVYDVLLANGLQSWVMLARVDIVPSGFTSANVGGGWSTATDGTVTYFASPGAMQFNVSDWLAHPNYSVGHEYGHVWANYYKWTYWQGSWDAFVAARGLTGNPNLDSGGCWYVEEIIADDYRQLFAATETLALVANCNYFIPAANDFPGLRDFLALTWTENHPPPAYGGSPPPAPTPPPTATPAPAATATRTATPVPTATAPPPPPTSTAIPTATKTPTPAPLATSTRTPTPSPNPIQTATPASTPAGAPTATPPSGPGNGKPGQPNGNKGKKPAKPQ